MPTSAITALATITLGGSQANVTFSSITSSYRDLMLVIASTSASTEEIVMQINSDTGSSNYWQVAMRGTGSAASSYNYAAANTYITLGVNSYSQTTPVFNSQINILDYSATDKHKTILIRNNDSVNGVEANAARWASTSAITSIKIYGRFSVNFTAGTTMTLYGIASA
jgi:uncharacterized protein YdbL (DUF1318 family)